MEQKDYPGFCMKKKLAMLQGAFQGKILQDHVPIDESDAALHLEREDGGVDVLGDDVPSVEEADCHVLAAPRVALDHRVARLERQLRYLVHGNLLVARLKEQEIAS